MLRLVRAACFVISLSCVAADANPNSSQRERDTRFDKLVADRVSQLESQSAIVTQNLNWINGIVGNFSIRV